MFIQWANQNPRHNFKFAIVDLETNALLGIGRIRKKSCLPDEAEFGIGVDADWWGRGIAQEAARIILSSGSPNLTCTKSMAWPFLRTTPSRVCGPARL
jgi:RimJ/RimL family protein N-acetyltransferase